VSNVATVPVTACIDGRLETDTVPATVWVAGKLITLTVPLIACVSGQLATETPSVPASFDQIALNHPVTPLPPTGIATPATEAPLSEVTTIPVTVCVVGRFETATLPPIVSPDASSL
jgi:hypothetical protein